MAIIQTKIGKPFVETVMYINVDININTNDEKKGKKAIRVEQFILPIT